MNPIQYQFTIQGNTYNNPNPSPFNNNITTPLYKRPNIPLPVQKQKSNRRSFNPQTSAKGSNHNHHHNHNLLQQLQQRLKLRNESTVKINRLSELMVHDQTNIYFDSTGASTSRTQTTDFDRQLKNTDWMNSNLPPITQLKLIKPIRTRQFLSSTHSLTTDQIYCRSKWSNSRTSLNGNFSASGKRDPVDLVIRANQMRYLDLKFDSRSIKIYDDPATGIKVEVKDVLEYPSSLKKRPIKEIDTNLVHTLKQKKHKYDIPLENSRTISAKEVLRMVDSSLISSEMELSQNNSTSTSILLTDTPLKPIPSYMRIFGANNNGILNDTPIKGSMLASTPQSAPRFLSMDDDYKQSPINPPKLRNL